MSSLSQCHGPNNIVISIIMTIMIMMMIIIKIGATVILCFYHILHKYHLHWDSLLLGSMYIVYLDFVKSIEQKL